MIIKRLGRKDKRSVDRHLTMHPLNIDRRKIIQAFATIATSTNISVSALLSFFSNSVNAATVEVNLDVKLVNDKLTYNGVTPGPTISANAGDNIDVHLVNNLPTGGNDCPMDHNTFHGENTTNLHTHGLHVSPFQDSTRMFDADNVFLKVVPKEQNVTCWDDSFRRHEARYRFELPTDHPPGTHWYHAHKHGATEKQVGEGLAGALIIREPKGLMPRYIEVAEEKIFMIGGFSQSVTLVKPSGGGEENPTIILRPGEVQRWRIINSSPFANSFVHLGLDSNQVELWQIAYDGLTLPKRIRVDPESNKEPWLNPAALAPGNRTDLMIRVPRDTPKMTVSISAKSAPLEFLHVGPLIAAASKAEIKVVIEGDPVDDLWSSDDKLPGPGLPPIEADDLPQRAIKFESVNDQFVIDGVPFDGEVKNTMKLGSSEEWTVSNTTPGTHPFHIHVNPFFVTHINGKKLAEDNPLRRWQDTIALPNAEGGKPGSITFNTRFLDFTGKFVIHCHILFHEDLGMMQVVEVV